MTDDEHPLSLLYRTKSCPCCRTVVHSKPIPLYLVKSIVSAFDKARTPAGAARPSPPPDDEDPWAGIFCDPRDMENYWSTDEDDDEDEDEEEDGEDDDGYGEGFWSANNYENYGTDEDEEPYDGPYINPRWAPPSVGVLPEDYPLLDPEGSEFAMLRRGATMGMIELFDMTYDHDDGLCAITEGNLVFLGWNIDLHPDDEFGEEYMNWILADMYDRHERWRVMSNDENDSWTAWRLVPAYEDEDYEDTDSEYWAEEMEY